MGKTARAFEVLILGVFFGLVPPAVFFIGTILFAAFAYDKEVLGPWVLWSLLPGLVIDITFLKKWARNAYIINAKTLAVLYVFYSVCTLGFFMGIPIGNIFLGILAGLYAARKMDFVEADEEKRNQNFKKTAKFTATVMVLICILLALWAIAGKIPGSTFETPYLSFTFTTTIFWTVVFAGSVCLILLQYWLTYTAATVVFNLSNSRKVITNP